MESIKKIFKLFPILFITIQSTLAASLHNFEREDLLSSLAGKRDCIRIHFDN